MSRTFVLWFLSVLMHSIYMWGYFRSAYIRCINVSVPMGSRHYKKYITIWGKKQKLWNRKIAIKGKMTVLQLWQLIGQLANNTSKNYLLRSVDQEIDQLEQANLAQCLVSTGGRTGGRLGPEHKFTCTSVHMRSNARSTGQNSDSALHRG